MAAQESPKNASILPFFLNIFFILLYFLIILLLRETSQRQSSLDPPLGSKPDTQPQLPKPCRK